MKITLCSIPYAAACAITDKYWHPHNLALFFVQIVVILPIYALCVLAVFRSEVRILFTRWQASRLVRA